MLEPTDVFVPGRLPVLPTNVYATRTESEQRFTKALRRGLVPVIFGEYGVGKTSMVRRCLLREEQQKRLVNVESVAGKRFDQVLSRCLEHIGYRVTTKRTEGRIQTISVARGYRVGFAELHAELTGGRNLANTSTDQWESELVVKSPSDSHVLALCDTRKLILVLDELHKASAQFVSLLSVFLKVVANKSCRNFRVVLLGTSSDASQLTEQDSGIDRLLSEVPVPAMSSSETRYIVEKGMHDLGIEIHDRLTKKIVRKSVGSPNVAQFLCLEIAERAYRRPSRRADNEDLDFALREYVTSKAQRLQIQYMKAIETVGQKRLRKQILHAMSEIDEEYVTMEQIRECVSERLGEEIKSSSLSGPLRQLKEDRYGNVLKDVARQKNYRVYNVTTFSDPAMKAFIRIQGEHR